MKKSFVLSTLVLVFSTGILFSFFEKKKVVADPKKSEIKYAMSHPMHSWEATSKDFKCALVYDTETQIIEGVAVVAAVRSFDSKNASRDSHALEVLDALKHPNITFSSTKVMQQGEQLQVAGNLTFHGITKPIQFVAKQQKAGNILTVTGGFTVQMKDFEIESPTLLGIKTKEDIKLSFKVVAIP